MEDAFKEEVAMEIQLDPEERRSAKEATYFDELDLRIADCKPHIASIEELKSFVVDSHDPSKSL